MILYRYFQTEKYIEPLATHFKYPREYDYRGFSRYIQPVVFALYFLFRLKRDL